MNPPRPLASKPALPRPASRLPRYPRAIGALLVLAGCNQSATATTADPGQVQPGGVEPVALHEPDAGPPPPDAAASDAPAATDAQARPDAPSDAGKRTIIVPKHPPRTAGVPPRSFDPQM